MPDLHQVAKESISRFLRRLVRTLAPWYGGVIAVYAPLHTIYAWLHSSGLINVPFQDVLFNLCGTVGLLAIFAAILGFCTGFAAFCFAPPTAMLLALFGVDVTEKNLDRAVRLVAILGTVGFGGYFFVLLAFDPKNYTTPPRYNSGFEWTFAILGAAVLLTTYVLFGKKLIDWLKSVNADEKEH